jgi:hypothetical protein
MKGLHTTVLAMVVKGNIRNSSTNKEEAEFSLACNLHTKRQQLCSMVRKHHRYLTSSREHTGPTPVPHDMVEKALGFCKLCDFPRDAWWVQHPSTHEVACYRMLLEAFAWLQFDVERPVTLSNGTIKRKVDVLVQLQERMFAIQVDGNTILNQFTARQGLVMFWGIRF